MAKPATKYGMTELGEDWIDAKDTARVLRIQPKHLATDMRLLVTHRSRNFQGKGARYVGYAYLRSEIELISEIKTALTCPTMFAARILQAMHKIVHAGLIPKIEKQVRS